MGGTGNLVNALLKLMNEIGVKITLNTTINKFILKNKKIDTIIDQTGKKRKADIFVSNLDPLYLYKNILTEEDRFILKFKKSRAKHSMGLFVLFFGTKKKFRTIKHHTIIFGKEYFKLLEKIFKKLELPEDISIYLHRPTATDNSFAPKGCDSFYALVPVPNLISKSICWKKEANTFKEHILTVLEKRLMPGLRKEIVQDFYMTPLDFKENYLSDAGAGFSLAPFFTQSAWFRFHNRSEVLNNLFLVGAGTHPGAGLPGVLSSARVLERLL